MKCQTWVTTAGKPVQIMLPEGCFREERFDSELLFIHNIIFYTWQVYRPPPPEISLSVCCDYVDNLPTVDAPELFGMDQNAETAFLANQGRALIADLLAAQPRLTAAVGYVICVKGAEAPGKCHLNKGVKLCLVDPFLWDGGCDVLMVIALCTRINRSDRDYFVVVSGKARFSCNVSCDQGV